MQYIAPIQQMERRRGTKSATTRRGDTWNGGGVEGWNMHDGEVRVETIEE